MKLYLIPPSETKKIGGRDEPMSRTFHFPLPITVARNATEKDLKCTGKRYQHGIQLNKEIQKGAVLHPLERYTGVLFTALGYSTMNLIEQKRIDTHVLIVSGLFGLLHPCDLIPNYKLPIETSGLRSYWHPKITHELLAYIKKQYITEIINLLPGSYQQILDRNLIHNSGIIHTFPDLPKGVKITHTIKLLRGKRLREQCQHESRI